MHDKLKRRILFFVYKALKVEINGKENIGKRIKNPAIFHYIQRESMQNGKGGKTFSAIKPQLKN